MHGKRPAFCFNFSELRSHSISLPALSSLLSVGKKLSEFVGYPIPVTITWDPNVLGFLHDTHFITIAKKLKIFSFEGEIDGWKNFTGENLLNPNTRILYFNDIKPIRDISPDRIGIEKAIHKQKLINNLKIRCSAIFNGFDDGLENTLYNTTLELVVNSLMHAEETAFIALQRTKKSITIAVCDAGIGFRRSLHQTFKTDNFQALTDGEALFIGSLIQKDAHGLRLAISEVLNYDSLDIAQLNEGWVTLSSFGAEIRWQKKTWGRALEYFETIDLKTSKPDLNKIFGKPITTLVDREKIETGYHRIYNHFLVGTRISFEIRF
jgi:hypothetical protein